jgi:hypothetical protein
MKCMSHGCARWAVETVLAFVSEFYARTRTQLDAKKIQVFLRSLNLPPRSNTRGSGTQLIELGGKTVKTLIIVKHPQPPSGLRVMEPLIAGVV